MVHEIYSKIAKHFSDTRYSHWEKVKDFIISLPKYSTVMDIGCGNGKYTTVRKDLLFLCFDITLELLQIAKENKNGSSKDFLNISCINSIPVKQVDYAISIAVIHHLMSYDDRIKAISNILEKVNKQALLTVWAYEQACTKKRDSKWKKININNDYLIPWLDRLTKETHWRFYHLFTKQEVEKVCKDIISIYKDITYTISFEHDNWIIQFNRYNKYLE
jgi:tRNA (uracil-5-)-methyltransferase TRM9